MISSKNGILKNKTRVWVTNQVSYLSNVDQLILLKDGEIFEKGTYEELMKTKGALFEFVQNHPVEEEEQDTNLEKKKETLNVTSENENLNE